MTKKILKIIIILLLLVGVGLFALVIMMEQLYWQPVSEKDSPDGKFTVFEYNYSSDGNRHAPYGTYVFIKPSFRYQKPINSHVIFAGYCSNKKLYKWISNKQIDITCITSDKDSIRSQSAKAYGISINVVTVQAKDS